jgi:4-hydroxy-tetrahydrodipicolinate synthase
MTTELELRGAGTALVTPFNSAGEIDLVAYRALVRRQVEAGVRMIVPCGTTGESATLSPKEKEQLVRACVEEVAGRAFVIPGTGGNDTRVAVETAKAAASWGADAVLSLAPPYNKPPQDALVAHFTAVAENAGVPVVVYNVPGRVGCNLAAATTLELAEVPGIAAVKEASADMSQCMEILRNKPEGFFFLSGEDALTFAFLALGGDGVISVIGNEAPGQLARLCVSALEGRYDEARELHARLLPLMETNFIESNPIPVKAALTAMGLIENHLRAPLRPLAPGLSDRLETGLRAAGIELNPIAAGAGT